MSEAQHWKEAAHTAKSRDLALVCFGIYAGMKMSSTATYPAKSARLELIELLKEQMYASYQPADRASITRPVLDRVVADLEHAVQLLDALQDSRALEPKP